MTRSFIKKWAKALRSGEIAQAHGCIKNGKALCCIGVGYLVKRGKRPSFEGTWPASQVIGLTGDQQKLLVDMNDSHRVDFPKIADWIEANL